MIDSIRRFVTVNCTFLASLVLKIKLRCGGAAGARLAQLNNQPTLLEILGRVNTGRNYTSRVSKSNYLVYTIRFRHGRKKKV
jgi:hypothetical protein